MLAARYAALLALLLSPARGGAWPQDNPHWRWTWYDSVLQAAFVAATVADCAMTVQAAKAPPLWTGDPAYKETNPFLGEHPSPAKIRSVCAATIIGHTALMVALPRPLRETVQMISIYVEVGAVRHQRSVGLSVRF